MKRNKIIISNRDTLYQYRIFRRTTASDLMKIDFATATPDLVLEPSTVEGYVVDLNEKGNGLDTPKVYLNDIGDDLIEIIVSENDGVTYYYGIVAFKNSVPSSEMSAVACSLKQDFNDIWNVIQTVAGTEVTRFQKKLAILESQFAQTIVPSVVPEDISYDLGSVIISKEVIINMPNVWYDINKAYNYRNYIQMNILAVSGQYKSDPVPLFNEEDKAFVPIHKIEILRRDITNDPTSTVPGTYAEEGTVIEKQIVLKDGIYYNKSNQNLPVNMLNHYGTVSVFDLGSFVPTLSIHDEIELAKKYKYTVRLFDCEERVSEPTVLIITT